MQQITQIWENNMYKDAYHNMLYNSGKLEAIKMITIGKLLSEYTAMDHHAAIRRIKTIQQHGKMQVTHAKRERDWKLYCTVITTR